MVKKDISAGTVHPIPGDWQKTLSSDPAILVLWEGLTPLARNEWICWIDSAKKSETRHHRMEVAVTQLTNGKRRPCCWPGCPHREKNGKA